MKNSIFDVPSSNLQSMLNFVSKSIQTNPLLYSQISTPESQHVVNSQVQRWNDLHSSNRFST